MGFDYIVVHVSYRLGAFLLYVLDVEYLLSVGFSFLVFCFFKSIFVLQLVLNLVCLQKEVILRSFYSDILSLSPLYAFLQNC